MFLSIGQFVAADGITTTAFHPYGLTFADGSFHSTWALLVLLLLGALISFVAIFLFRNRMLQVRLTIFSILLLAGYYIAFFVFMLILKRDLEATYQIGWALCLPAIAIILNYLSFRAIFRDELMVRAADRLR
jgi:hypothetical protein